MTGGKLAPPRLAQRMVALLVRDERWRDVMLGDLAEEFDEMAGRRSAWVSIGWYWGQTLLVAVHGVVQLVRSFLAPTGEGFMGTLFKEGRFAVRSLQRQPVSTAIILLTLALGLGATAATFGMVDHLLLRPFTIRNVDRLVVFAENSSLSANQRRDTVAVANFLKWRAQARTLRRFSAFESWNVNLSGGDQPERIDGQRVSADFFPLLGVMPAVGRALQQGDEVFGRHQQIVIGDGLWHRRFGGDPAVIGRTCLVDGLPYEIVGVTPPGFDFPTGTEAWAPLAFRPEETVDRRRRRLTVIAELQPEATLAMASAEMATIYAGQRSIDPEATRGRQVFVRGFTEGLVDVGMPTVLALQQAAAVFLLLIGCTNVASLLLAGGAERQRELAVRLALGARRAQLVRQLLIEHLILAMIAVPLSLGTTWALVHGLQAVMPASLIRYAPGWTEMGVDNRVILFTVAVAALTSVLFGLLPALNLSRAQPTAVLRDGGRSVTAGRARGRLQRGLVVAEIALALPLLVASGLASLAAYRFASGPQGFNPDGAYALRLTLPSSTYADATSRRRFVERLVEQASTEPGVSRAAITTVLPSSSSNQDRQVSIDGVADDPDAPRIVNFRAISSAYFDTLEIPLHAGRPFTPADREDSQPVSIVSESFVRTYLSPGSPLGRRIRLGASGDSWTTVVGVSGDTIDDWFSNRREPTIFVPFAQFPSADMTLVASTTGEAAQLADGLRRALNSIDATQAAYDTMTVREVVHMRTTGLRFIAGLMAAFGGVALVLSTVGVYGIMANFVAVRRHELGVRLALGASSGDLLALTLGQGAKITAVGLALGLSAAVGLARVMENALFGIVAVEPSLFASVTAALAFVAIAATVIPAWRAMRLDPALVLRE